MQITPKRQTNKTPKFSGRIKDILLLAVLALVVLLAAWKLFYTDDSEDTSAISVASDTEKRISQMLRQMEGVGDANVVVCETEDGVQSVVVVCEGANDLQVIMHVREAVAAALGTQEKFVKVYLKKE